MWLRRTGKSAGQNHSLKSKNDTRKKEEIEETKTRGRGEGSQDVSAEN